MSNLKDETNNLNSSESNPKHLPNSNNANPTVNSQPVENEHSKKEGLINDEKRSKSKSRSRSRDKKKKAQIEEPEQNEEEEENEDLVNDDELMRVMGFNSFKTSKNEDHTSSACEGVRKNTQVRRQYRQYMNRRGGFNRNLDKI